MQKEMKCEHDTKELPCRSCTGYRYPSEPMKPICKTCTNFSNFECKLCKKENETKDKPLTIVELEQMNGLPVWNYNSGEYMLVNVDRGRLYDYCGAVLCFTDVETDYNIYKEKPTPRMVTIETAIKEKLFVRFENFHHIGFLPVFDALDYILAVVSSETRTKLLNEPVWEVKEG